MPRESFDRELHSLEENVLEYGRCVAETIPRAVEALKARDRPAAEALIAADASLNTRRYELENQCYTILATQQPTARDLRTIVGTLVIVMELERIADYTKGIAEIILRMGDAPLLKPLIDIPRMAEQGRAMVMDALDALARSDTALAQAVCTRDDEIDHLYNQVFRELLTYIIEDPRVVTRAMYLLFVAHNLERIGDRATNIGERVIYMVTGRLEELNV